MNETLVPSSIIHHTSAILHHTSYIDYYAQFKQIQDEIRIQE